VLCWQHTCTSGLVLLVENVRKAQVYAIHDDDCKKYVGKVTVAVY